MTLGGTLLTGSLCSFRWQLPWPYAVPTAADAQIASDDTRPSQHTREKPLCRPAPEAGAVRQASLRRLAGHQRG